MDTRHWAAAILIPAAACSGGSGPTPAASVAAVAAVAPTPAPTPAPVRRVEVEGWTVEVRGVKTRKEPLFINEPTFSFGPAPASKKVQGRKIGEKGLVWLVSVEATRKEGGPEDLWARDIALLVGKDERLPAAGGGPEDASLFLKGMGFNKTGRGVLAFEVPRELTPTRLQVLESGPVIDLPAPDAEASPLP